MVKFLQLDHSGGYYLYRVHNNKLNTFCSKDAEFLKLRSFMNNMFRNCPNSYFNSGPRGSSLKFKTRHDITELCGHQVCGFAKNGLEVNKNRFKSNHSKVQMFMLENDKNTFAIEVPIWLNSNEIEGYSGLFGSNEPLTGHIDVLGIENGKVWVWDYKPNAYKEKYASTQVYFYSLMLSKRTGIPLDKFRCGYFDWERAYMFKPMPIEEKGLINADLGGY